MTAVLGPIRDPYLNLRQILQIRPAGERIPSVMSEIEKGLNNPGNNPSDQEKQSSDTFTLPETGSDQPDKKPWDPWKGKQEKAGEAIKKGATKGLVVAALAAAGLVGIAKCTADSIAEDTGSNQSPADTFSPSPSPEETTTSPEDSADSTESPDAASTDYPTPGGETATVHKSLDSYREPMPLGTVTSLERMPTELGGNDIANYNSQSHEAKAKWRDWVMNAKMRKEFIERANKGGANLSSDEEVRISPNDSLNTIADKVLKDLDRSVLFAGSLQKENQETPGCNNELDDSRATKYLLSKSSGGYPLLRDVMQEVNNKGNRLDKDPTLDGGVRSAICPEDTKNVPEGSRFHEYTIISTEEEQKPYGPSQKETPHIIIIVQLGDGRVYRLEVALPTSEDGVNKDPDLVSAQPVQDPRL